MISSYDELRAQVAKWLGRTTDPDLAANIPTFVQLFESQARQRLTSRVGEVRSVNSSITQEYTALPSDFIRVRSVKRLSPQEGKITLVTDAVIDSFDTEAGLPVRASISQRSLRLHPKPSMTVVVQLTYTTLPALSGTNASNWLLDLHPEAYLYGALAHSARYLDDDRADSFEARSFAILDEINKTARPLQSSADLTPTFIGNVV